ncbi:MAG: hypothetical protein R3304_04500 [Longimicrobiales bacterium]|nr:hypothetical protein [Longimicrobiales bacterium]
MFELKKLTPQALDSAREKASRYRLLNHPFLAESICRDILAIAPDDQETLVALCLTLCDQFGVEGGATVKRAMDVVGQLEGEYERRYYSGIVCERMAFSGLRRGGPAAGHVAYDWFVKAMGHFDSAAEIRPEGNDDAILRWNTCARVINERSDVHPGHHDTSVSLLE